MPKRKIIVNIAMSADGYIARTDGSLDWLTRRPAPKGFYGLPKLSRSIDAKILGRKTFDLGVKMGASFSRDNVHYVFSHQSPPASAINRLTAGRENRETSGRWGLRLRRTERELAPVVVRYPDDTVPLRLAPTSCASHGPARRP